MSIELSIPGIPVVGPYLQELRQQVADLLCVTHLRFAGAQPISFTKKHLEILESKNFFACEKTDGIRILLYTTYNRVEKKYETFLIDRKNDFFFISALLPVPPSKSRKSYETFQTNTILDGELIIDTLPGGLRKLRFLVFDCLSCLNTLLIKKPFHKRLG
ncbi:Dcp1p-Dcp2p decapping enzyme complex alpha subunit, partial [Coelomomyces lativittatus]